MNHLLPVVFIIVTALGVSCSQKRYTDPLSPEKALESFQLQDGFTIETFAAEPHVVDPVEIVFDEQGNIYVVEMPDYPFKPEPGKGQGRIKMLADTDGDGRIDQATVFADKITEATSVLPWKGGLLVTAAPDILYLKDTDGDFKADTKEVLFTGFFENNSEAQITNLRFSVDNWIYAANNGQAGEVSFKRKPNAAPLNMQGGDFRFRLDRDQFELATGPAQFGQCIDDWGHRFFTQNTLHIRQAVIPWRYMIRNENMPSVNAIENISDHELEMFQDTPPPYWRAERTNRRQQQYKEQGLDRVEYVEDHFTGASGGTIYAGDAFPEAYYGNVFTGDVAGNLVHRDILVSSDSSPVFIAKRGAAEQDREFLSSTDPWFRPANFTVGPDGYLYVIDMYRQHIETPVSIPDDLKEDMDFMNGSQHGRIYRIKPAHAASQPEMVPDLRHKQPEAYVELLDHPNRWWRLQAQKILLEKQDVSVIPKVKAMFAEHQDPRARLHALFVLEGLNALNKELVSQAMADVHPGVRKYGMMLSEQYPACLPQLLQGTQDSSAWVALQAILSAGEFSEQQEVVEAFAKVIDQHGESPWFRTAVLSAKAGTSISLLRTLKRQTTFFEEATDWKTGFLEDFSYVLGSGYPDNEMKAYLDFFSVSDMENWQITAISGLISGLKKSTTLGDEVNEKLADMETKSSEGASAVIQFLKMQYAKQ